MSTRTLIVVVILAWILWLPIAAEVSGRIKQRIDRHYAVPPQEPTRPPLQLVQSTLGEQLRADQRGHRARWTNHEGDDVA